MQGAKSIQMTWVGCLLIFQSSFSHFQYRDGLIKIQDQVIIIQKLILPVPVGYTHLIAHIFNAADLNFTYKVHTLNWNDPVLCV